MGNEKKTSTSTVIAMCNQKGGVAKTTSSVAVSATLAEMGYKVLLVDNDPQADATKALGLKKPDGAQITIATIFSDLLSGKMVPVEKGILETKEGFDLLPSDNAYAGIELQLVQSMSREYYMKDYLDTVRANYDYIIIDCPPNIGTLTINALTAADKLLIPAQAQMLSVVSIEQILATAKMIMRHTNRELMISGIFLTMFDARRNEDKLIREAVKKQFSQTKVFDTVIPFSVKASESTSHCKSIINYEPKSKVAEAYRTFVKEIIDNG